jgi:large subunit ribosomal protein L24
MGIKIKYGSKPKKIKTKLKTSDEVMVIAGRDKGKKGQIQTIDRKRGKVQIPNINMVKKHRRANQEQKAGEVVEIPSMLSISNVMIFCPKCSNGVRIRLVREKGKKRRFCHKCDYSFDNK